MHLFDGKKDILRPNPDKPENTNHKFQITNKSQHAAQAPALRVTEIQNPKQVQNIEKRTKNGEFRTAEVIGKLRYSTFLIQHSAVQKQSQISAFCKCERCILKMNQ